MAFGNVVDGFDFQNEEDVVTAQNEVERIEYISARMNMSNIKGVLAVYDKLIANNVFVTPVGVEYLRLLRKTLINSGEVPLEQIRDIPVAVAINASKEQNIDTVRRTIERVNASRNLVKTFKTEYKVSLCINVALIIVIIAMFGIVLKADTPNMINYRTAILNQYADWDQELKEREKAVRVREKELELEPGQNFEINVEEADTE